MVSNTNDVTSNLEQFSHTRGRTYAEKISKKDAGENIWTQEGRSNRRTEKTAHWRAW